MSEYALTADKTHADPGEAVTIEATVPPSDPDSHTVILRESRTGDEVTQVSFTTTGDDATVGKTGVGHDYWVDAGDLDVSQTGPSTFEVTAPSPE